MANVENLVGKKYGRWTVISRVQNHVSPSGQSVPMWRCKCDCGNEGTIAGYALRGGRSKSCGCYCNEESSKRLFKHGGKGTRLFTIWSDMKQRCNNKNCKEYENYGGRGIKVCVGWESDFTNFRDWSMNKGYKKELTIDRIDNSKGYCPDNCRWVSMKVQQNNKRNTFMIKLDGEEKSISEWSEITGVKRTTIKQRIKRGWDSKSAAITPVRRG